MFQGETWDYDGLDGSFDNLGDIHQEETSEHLHPAVVAAIALGCVSGALAITTWILTTCGSCIRIRRRNRDEEANEPSYRSTTLESQSNDYIHTLATLTPHGSSMGDTPESVPLSTRVVSRPGPNGNVNRDATEEQHNGQRLVVTLSNMPVDLLGPLAFILGCISIMYHCPRTPKSCQQRTGPFAEPGTSTARQLDTLSITINRGNGLSNELAPLTPVATRAGPTTPGIDFTHTLLFMHVFLWICIALIGLCTLENNCLTCVSRGVCYCWPKSGNERCQCVRLTICPITCRCPIHGQHGSG
ncbi:hypothetical protein LX32DRAFT_152625 [Colletotrichum zoysiae]|uniref:Uncharacterized protein n=1 Tax=Colletotrichum zoysiae TaxID=1216348 RepID=A0AAD9HUB3_9PEZI|nr:hypothetical protein LX32DRAFT_152625 [Colletotrichum zoysiae]